MTERTYGGYTLAELRALCVGATPGPWYALPADFKKWVTTAGVTDTEWRLNHDADAAFVAATREALPDLLDRVAALEAALRQVAALNLEDYDVDAIDAAVIAVRAVLEDRNG